MREIFKPVIVLLIVCVVISFFVAYVFNITEDTISEIEKAANEKLMSAVLPDGNPFEDITLEVVSDATPTISSVTINAVYSSQKGFVFNVSTKGYGGEVVVFVGINNDGTINNVQVGKNNETPSVGKKAEEKDFTGRFIGIDSKQNLKENVDTISGATITTRGVIEAVQEACHYFSSYIEEVSKEEN
ncbi:MAG: RnfABCDGE type electron transport complex subunit G [Clostridia bacterium]|nr:RnfABCDGE type electron transport complex subunit G [Clostridia bacterium]